MIKDGIKFAEDFDKRSSKNKWQMRMFKRDVEVEDDENLIDYNDEYAMDKRGQPWKMRMFKKKVCGKKI